MRNRGTRLQVFVVCFCSKKKSSLTLAAPQSVIKIEHLRICGSCSYARGITKMILKKTFEVMMNELSD
mgnify:CR=1